MSDDKTITARPFTPAPFAPEVLTPYQMECAIAKASTEEYLIGLLGAAVRMPGVSRETKKRWANVAERRVAELQYNPPTYGRTSVAEAFPDVTDDRPAMSIENVVHHVNGNREWFCVEHGVFMFEGPDGKRVSIHDYFSGSVEIPHGCPECGHSRGDTIPDHPRVIECSKCGHPCDA